MRSEDIMRARNSTQKWDRRLLELARHVSVWSRDPSTQVGAVISREKRVVSLGFNGFPQGMDDDEALYTNREEKYSRIVHGEMNALLFGGKLDGSETLYTYPFAPCDRCAVVMLQAGIQRFVYPPLDSLPVEQQERWRKSMEQTERFFVEMEAEYVHLDLNALLAVPE